MSNIHFVVFVYTEMHGRVACLVGAKAFAILLFSFESQAVKSAVLWIPVSYRHSSLN